MALLNPTSSSAGPDQMVRWIKQDERDHVSQLPFRSGWKERKGKERKGKERKGKERKGKGREYNRQSVSHDPCPTPSLTTTVSMEHRVREYPTPHHYESHPPRKGSNTKKRSNRISVAKKFRLETKGRKVKGKKEERRI